MPMPEMNALPENLIFPLPRRHITAPNTPMSSKPMPNLASEQAKALQADSRTNMHSDPISIAANVAARNALRYPLFMLHPFRGRANYITCLSHWQFFYLFSCSGGCVFFVSLCYS